MITPNVYGHFNANVKCRPPKKRRQLLAHSKRFSHALSKLNSVVKSGCLADEHGLSNLCHRNAIYISVYCLFFLFPFCESIELRFALNFVARWSMNMFFQFCARLRIFFDAYASLIDRESTGVLLAKSKKKNRLIDVDISWSSCINKLKIGFRVFFAFANLRNIGVSTGLLKPTNDKYIKYFSSVCSCDARRCKTSVTDFSF